MSNRRPQKGVDETAKREHQLRLLRQREADAHAVARRHAAADPSDPFVYVRIRSHILNGVGELYGRALGASKETA